MSANIDGNNMFYVRDVPWHNLGTRLEEAPTSADAIVAAGMDWAVEQQPLVTESGVTTNLLANVRSDNKAFLGAVTGKYTIVQNVDAFDFMDELSSQEVVYETAGVLGKGENVWLLAKMDNYKILGDDMTGYLCLTNSHDGKGSIKMAVTPIRVVCQNTLNLALANAKRTWTTRHMGDFKAKRIQAAQTLGLYENYMSLFNVEAENLAKIPVSVDKASKMVNDIFPLAEDTSTRKENNIVDARQELMYRFTEAPDIANFRYTGWGFMNAVTDYVGHTAPKRSTDTFEERRFKNVVLNGSGIVDRALTLVKSA